MVAVPPEAPANLTALLTELWDRLDHAARSAKSGWHTAALATVTAAGEPTVRTVVLRRVERNTRRLGCNTDRRAAKVADVTTSHRVAWLFYDPQDRVQLRACGRATIGRGGAEVDAAWDETTLESRRCYLAPSPPGTPQDAPVGNLPATFRERVPTREESEAGRRHFATIDCIVDELDWLLLHSTGHLRARFLWDGANWAGSWVAA